MAKAALTWGGSFFIDARFPATTRESDRPSPALDGGDASLLPPDTFDLNGNGNTTEPLPVDWRGLPRVSGAGLDIGAYEHQTQVVVNRIVSCVHRSQIHE